MMASSESSTWEVPRLRISRDGTWHHEDQEITHEGVLANLWANLRTDADGYHVQAGPVRVPVEVEDAPFAVLRVEREGDRLILTASDLSREPLDPATLRVNERGVPYCRIKQGRFEARFSRAAAYQLLEHAEYDEPSGRATLVVGGTRYRLPNPPAEDAPLTS
ncbi:MAG: hypothetical protein C5B48_05220 [Candidatus Rokuibacteriota bacterium]|nr:MAG: hypothetical protein C5B48_05220 [Candidatus Rokubacteria bacterium]